MQKNPHIMLAKHARFTSGRRSTVPMPRAKTMHASPDVAAPPGKSVNPMGRKTCCPLASVIFAPSTSASPRA